MFITGNKFKSISNFYLDEFGFGCLREPGNNEIPKFFVKTDYIDSFFSKVKPNFPYILLTHNSDYHINSNHFNFLNDTFLIKWFAQNVDFSHPKLFSIPIGIANEKWEHGNLEVLEKIINENNVKENLIYTNFSIHTNYKERTHCYNQISKFGIQMSQRKDFETYLREVSTSYFVISPNGNGVDCHKTWESLYLKSIPIVTESLNINFYKNFPIVIIKNWSDFDINYFNKENYNKIWNDFDILNLSPEKFIKY